MPKYCFHKGSYKKEMGKGNGEGPVSIHCSLFTRPAPGQGEAAGSSENSRILRPESTEAPNTLPSVLAPHTLTLPNQGLGSQRDTEEMGLTPSFHGPEAERGLI